jgi:ankyrin repeat protein
MKMGMTLLLFAGAAFLAGCATEPASSQAQTPVPALAQDRGRIYFYRTSRTGTQVLPAIELNGLVVGASKPRSFFFVDRPPGRYMVEVAGAESKCALTLDKGQKCYVRVDFPSKGTGEILGEVALTPMAIALTLVVFNTPLLPGGSAGPISPAHVANATGERKILKCHYAGSYWSSLGYGGEIQEAAASGDLPRVEALLKADPALISLQDASGWTPLFFAVASGYTNVPGWLLEHAADVNATTHGGWTALHWAAVYDQKVMAELLLADKAQVDARDNNGETPLHKAAANGSRDVAELLVAWHADVEAKASTFLHSGWTPLHFAAGAGEKEVAEFLLAHGAMVDSRNSGGGTPLDEAAMQGDEVISALFLSNKADVNTRNNVGATPLLWAVLYDHKEEAELLLDHGADVNAMDNRGRTPLWFARRDKALAALLRQHGGHE